MNQTQIFSYKPGEHECEKASNSYLMSLVAIVAGLPIPLINLVATLVFYLSNRKGTYFVRWHCTQALLSQASLFQDGHISSAYIAYLMTVFFFNITDLIATIYTAIETRKGKHIVWWFYGDLTHLICKP
jgi:uncharacterized membrane protein